MILTTCALSLNSVSPNSYIDNKIDSSTSEDVCFAVDDSVPEAALYRETLKRNERYPCSKPQMQILNASEFFPQSYIFTVCPHQVAVMRCHNSGCCGLDHGCSPLKTTKFKVTFQVTESDTDLYDDAKEIYNTDYRTVELEEDTACHCTNLDDQNIHFRRWNFV